MFHVSCKAVKYWNLPPLCQSKGHPPSISYLSMRVCCERSREGENFHLAIKRAKRGGNPDFNSAILCDI